MEFGVKKQLTEQVRQDVFIDMIKRKSKYVLENLGRIQQELRLKTQSFNKNKQSNLVTFSSYVRQMLSSYEIMVNEIKFDLEMSDLKVLGLAIQKLFTHMINISASLMKGCLKFHKAASNNRRDSIRQTNADSANHQISEFEGKMDQIRMREHMRFMFDQQDQKGQGNKFQENQQLWNLINKNVKENVIKCAQLQNNQVDSKLAQVTQNIFKNEANITKILNMLEYNLSFRYDDISIPKLIQMQSQYASYTTDIVMKIQAVFKQLKFKKDNMKQVCLQTLPDHQLQFYKAQFKAQKNKFNKLYQQTNKEKAERAKQIQKLVEQVAMWQQKSTTLNVQNKLIKERLINEQQMHNQLKKIKSQRQPAKQTQIQRQSVIKSDHDKQSVFGITNRSNAIRQKSRVQQVSEIDQLQQNQKQNQKQNQQKEQNQNDQQQKQVNHVIQSVLARVGVRKGMRTYTINKAASSLTKSNFFRAQEGNSVNKKGKFNNKSIQSFKESQKTIFKEASNSLNQKTVLSNQKLLKVGRGNTKMKQKKQQNQNNHQAKFYKINQDNDASEQLKCLNLVKHNSCFIKMNKKQSYLTNNMIIQQQVTPYSCTKKSIEDQPIHQNKTEQSYSTTQKILSNKGLQKEKKLSLVNNLINMSVSSQKQNEFEYCMPSKFSKCKLKSEDKQNKVTKYHSLFFNRPHTASRQIKHVQTFSKKSSIAANTLMSTFQTYNFQKKQAKIRQLNKMIYYKK